MVSLMTGLEILCSGKGKVHWKESRGNGPTVPPPKRLLVNPCGNQELENGKTKMTSSPLNSQTIMSVEESYIEERLVLLETSKELPLAFTCFLRLRKRIFGHFYILSKNIFGLCQDAFSLNGQPREDPFHSTG